LCVDPKGELAAITAARRGPGGGGVKGLRQNVCVLDPFGIVPGWRTASYNVFDEMERVAQQDPRRPVSYAGKIAEALVKPLSERDHYFDQAAQTFLRGLVLYVFQGPKENRNLVYLRRLVSEGDVATYKSANVRAVRGEALTPFDTLLVKMQN